MGKEELQDSPNGLEKENGEMLGRYQATLIGGAIGDTLGMPVEGWNRAQIQKYLGGITEPIDPVILTDREGNRITEDENGRVFYFSSAYKKGQWTDDTALTLATARSITQTGGFNLLSHAAHTITVYDERNKYVHGNGSGNFGKTTIGAIENLKKGIPPTESGIMGPKAGNAPALKMGPVGMVMHATGNYYEGLEFAERAGQMTHLDARSIASGVVQAHAVFALFNGVSRDEFLPSLIEVAQKWEKSIEQGKKVTLTDRLKYVAEMGDDEEERAYQNVGPGWAVTRNYPFTLFLFKKYWDNPLEGLLKTVNYGGDCDSTAAMFGTLAGARSGMIFPDSWMQVLEAREELEGLANGIYRFRSGNHPASVLR